MVYFNTNNNKELLGIFEKERTTEKIILNLSLLTGETILKKDTLIIFDNLEDVNIVKTLKNFGNEHSEYHIIAITSHKDNLSLFKALRISSSNSNTSCNAIRP